MVRFSAGLGHLFRQWELPQRFSIAREHGFDGVELTLPYAHSAAQLAAAKRDAGVEVILFTAPLGDFMSGGEGIAAVASRREEFQDSVAQALEYAQALEAHYVQFVAGRCAGAAEDPKRCDTYVNTYIENMRYAVDAFASTRTRLLIEAINNRDFPDYLLSTPALVRSVCAQFADGEVQAVFDTVHLALMGVDPVREWREHAGDYAHVQLADAPNRTPPGSGTLDFPALYREFAAGGYRGWLGAEYHPDPESPHSLGWMTAARAAGQ